MTLPTPCARDGKGPGHQHGLPDLVENRGGLLPTPTASAYGSNRSTSAGATVRPSLAGLVTRRLLPTPTVADARSSANATARRSTPLVGHAGHTLTDFVRLLPTPKASDGTKGCPAQRGSKGDLTLPSTAVRLAVPAPTGDLPGGQATPPSGDGSPQPDPAWGPYADAVARWEALLGRPAPAPTQPGRHGKPVLAPPFVEWLMGLDDGWVTTLGLPRTLALRVLGNGCVPQQAALALVLLLCPHRWQVTR